MSTAQERQARQDARDAEDFDAFWSTVDAKGQTLRNVFGRDVTLPASLPLSFEIQARRVAATEDEETTRQLVGQLYGPDALDYWTERGCDGLQFAVLLMYGSANASGHPLSLQEALDEVQAAMAGEGGPGNGQSPGSTSPGPNRAERRRVGRAGPMPGLSSSNTGEPSSPTFDVSTGSVGGSWQPSPSGSSEFWSAVSPNSRSGDSAPAANRGS